MENDQFIVNMVAFHKYLKFTRIYLYIYNNGEHDMHDLVSLNDQFFGVHFQSNLRSSKYAIWIDPEKKQSDHIFPGLSRLYLIYLLNIVIYGDVPIT